MLKILFSSISLSLIYRTTRRHIPEYHNRDTRLEALTATKFNHNSRRQPRRLLHVNQHFREAALSIDTVLIY